MLEAVGDLDQQLITDHVTKAVVDQFEAVQVEKHDDQGFPAAHRLLDRKIQPVEQHGAIRQLRQQVVVGLVSD